MLSLYPDAEPSPLSETEGLVSNSPAVFPTLPTLRDAFWGTT